MTDVITIIDDVFGDGRYDRDLERKTKLAQCLSFKIPTLSPLQKEALEFSLNMSTADESERDRIDFLERLVGEETAPAINRGSNRLVISCLDKNEGATAYLIEYFAEWSAEAGLDESQVKACIEAIFSE